MIAVPIRRVTIPFKYAGVLGGDCGIRPHNHFKIFLEAVDLLGDWKPLLVFAPGAIQCHKLSRIIQLRIDCVDEMNKQPDR
jgi:hypothetical protein